MNSDDMAVNAEIMRQVMRYWASGVTVVTTRLNGENHGMTVSSFLSVSLEPPLVLVSLQMESRTHALVQEAGIFSVSILEQAGEGISNRFAGRDDDALGDRFDGVETFTLKTGAPCLAQGLASLDCRVVAAYPVSDHTLFIGEVMAVWTRLSVSSEKDANGLLPIVYYNRDYWRLERQQDD